MIDLTKYKKGAKFVTRNGYIAELIFINEEKVCFFFRLEKVYNIMFFDTLYVAYNKHGQYINGRNHSFDIVEELKI